MAVIPISNNLIYSNHDKSINNNDNNPNTNNMIYNNHDIWSLNQPFATTNVKNFKDFVLLNSELYYRGSTSACSRPVLLKTK